jgi:hypothetical protein
MEGAPSHSRVPRRDGPLSRALDALFPEARRLGRLRRLRYVVLLLLVCAIGVGLARTGDPGKPVAVSVLRAAHATVTSVVLPPAGHFSSLAVIGGRLQLSGGPQGSLPVSGYQTSVSDGRAAGTCHVAVVDPRTLAVGPVANANCGDPSLYGEHVLPIAYLLRRAGANGAGVGTIAVRIARTDRAARDGYTLGPVVTTYPQCSDCQIAWIYGDDSLWLYNPLIHPPRGVLLRVSVRTGAVLQRWAMPEILRALLAVDAQGLWLSPSIESGTPGRLPPSRRVPYQSLYRTTPGASSPQRVLTETGAGARWLVARGDTTSAAIDTGHGYSRIWTFTDHQPPVHGPAINDGQIEGEIGTGGPIVAGNATIGFFSVTLGNGTESVTELGPLDRTAQTIATIRSPNVNLDYPPPTGTTLDGSFFFLDPPVGQSQSSRDLHRVTPR